MQLLLNQASPYARLARVVVHEKGLTGKVELRWIDPWASPPELLAVNPAAKVPALVVDDKHAIIDSTCICMHLDQVGEGAGLFPAGVAMLMKYGLGRSLIDAAFGVTIERRYGKEAGVLIERWLAACQRTIAALENDAGLLQHEQPDIGELSIAVALAYLDFRLPEVGWRANAPRLGRWYERIGARPSLRATVPE